MELGMGPIRSSVPSLFSRDTQKHERNLSDGALRKNDSAILRRVEFVFCEVNSIFQCTTIYLHLTILMVYVYLIMDVEYITSFYFQLFGCAWNVREISSDVGGIS